MSITSENAEWWNFLAVERRHWICMLETRPAEDVLKLLRLSEARAQERADDWRTMAEQEKTP